MENSGQEVTREAERLLYKAAAIILISGDSGQTMGEVAAEMEIKVDVIPFKAKSTTHHTEFLTMADRKCSRQKRPNNTNLTFTQHLSIPTPITSRTR